MNRLHFTIHGDVQGVSFRHYTKQLATELNLTGSVKNNSDGTVEITAEGHEQDLKKLLEWCHKGPELAKVTKISSEWLTYKAEFQNFTITYEL
jgi:acylphosphatase